MASASARRRSGVASQSSTLCFALHPILKDAPQGGAGRKIASISLGFADFTRKLEVLPGGE
jgi:hypothetical protein